MSGRRSVVSRKLNLSAITSESLSDALGVGVQPFGFRQRRNRLREGIECVLVQSLDCGRAEERIDRQATRDFCQPGRREHVVRSRSVIARSDGCVRPEEDASGTVDSVEKVLVVRRPESRGAPRRTPRRTAVLRSSTARRTRRLRRCRARARITSSRSRSPACFSISSQTASANSASSVMATDDAFSSCSACATTSLATNAGSAVSSARTSSSLGPARKSIATSPCTSAFAAVTHLLPGPTTFCTRSICSVPYAIAAMACAPPTRYTRVRARGVNRRQRDVVLRFAGRRGDHDLFHAGHFGRDDAHQRAGGVRRGAAGCVHTNALDGTESPAEFAPVEVRPPVLR